MAMRCLRFFATLGLMLPMLSLFGCRNRYTPPEEPMPANTVMLSAVMRELAAQPGFKEKLLAELKGAKHPDAK